MTIPFAPAGAYAFERRDACRLDDAASATHAGFRGCARARAGRHRRHSCAAAGASQKPVRPSFDLAALGRRRDKAGNIAIPLVKMLTADVAKTDAEAARYVHWGATSQDVIDTATMLQLRDGIDALLADLDRAVAGFAKHATAHRQTATVARTWLQHALPMPFGLKLAEYAAALHRSRARLKRLRREAWFCNSAARPERSPLWATRARCRRAACERVARSAAAGSAVAHPPRPIAEVAAGIRDPRRHLRQDCTRRFAADADRVAEAFEPAGEGRGGSSTCRISAIRSPQQPHLRQRPWRQILRRQSSRHRCRSTSAAPVRGMPNGRRCQC